VNPETESPLFFYCHDGVTVEGPHSWEQILELYEAGAVSAETAICMAGYEEWTTLGSYFPPAEESAEELPPGATMILEPAYNQTHSPVTAQAPESFVSRKKRWMAVAGTVLLLATTGYFGAGFFQRGGSSEVSAGAPAGNAEGERWVWAIEPRYQEAFPFGPSGVAPVKMGGKWGLIDRKGQEVLPCAYDEIEMFTKEEGVAVREGLNWGLVDVQGKVLLKPAWEQVQPLVNGFIPVKKDGKWGYADASGKLVIPCTWDDAWRFSAAGRAVVTEETAEGRKRGYIDKSGRVITPLEWDGAQTQVAEGFGAVRRGGGWALVGKDGRVLGEPQWEMQWRLLRADLGFLPVRKDGKWGLIALDGAILVEPAWDWIAPGENGVLLAAPGSKSIFVGAGGKTIFESGPWEEIRGVQSPFDWRERPGFIEGFLAVRSGDKWGFIDEKGKTVVAAAWDQVGNFSEGFVAVRNKSDRDGWRFLAADGSPAFANPDGVTIGYNWSGPRFRNGKVEARATGFVSVAVDRQGKIVGEWNRNSWLPEDVTIQGIRFGYVSRHGRRGYMRNFADGEGKIFMRDVPVEMSSLDDPFPYPGPPRFGLAAATGEVLVEPSWDCVQVISRDWVRVWVDGRQGLVNGKGKQILRPEWDRVKVERNGLLVATKGDRKEVFDSAGKALLPMGPDGAEYVDYYADGFMVRSSGPDGSTLWSLCDPTSTAQVSFENAARVYWNEGLAQHGLLWMEERDTGRWSLVRRDGTAVGITQDIQPDMWFMRDGFGVLGKDDGTKIHLGVDGKTLGTTAWEDAALFHHGLARVKTGGKWGFIDTTGKMVIAPEWDEANDLANVGTEQTPILLARVAREGRWGCIDASGREVIEPSWDKMELFRQLYDGRFIAPVQRGDLWGVVDATGKTIIEPRGTSPDVVESFGVLRLWIKQEGEEYVRPVQFDANGTELDWWALSDLRVKIRSTPDELAGGTEIIQSPEQKYGLKDASGKIVLEPEWNDMTWVAQGVLAAWTDDDGGTFDATGKPLFRDNAERRLARFNHEYKARQYRQGLIVIEATPVWGYAELATKRP
jgi:hypothetical protein